MPKKDDFCGDGCGCPPGISRRDFIKLTAVAVSLAGCRSTQLPNGSSEETPKSVLESATLQYIGHSCFLLTAADGTRIIMDPYVSFFAPMEIQKFPSGLTADAVTISHLHNDHVGYKQVVGDPQLFLNPGSYQVGGVTITGYESDHGLMEGKPSGSNTVFALESGDLKIVHLGGAGVITQPDILAAIEKADVVMVNISGTVEHPIPEEMAQIRQSRVRTVLPAHYSISEKNRLWRTITLEEFYKQLPSNEVVVKEASSEVTITHNMPRQVLVLTPLALSMQGN